MDFQSILQKAKKLTNEIQNMEVASVDLPITQVLEEAQELHGRVTQTATQDIQARILLGSKGIDLPQISQKLETLNSRKTFEPLDPIADTDIQSFLKNEKENAILSVIEEVHKNSYQSAQKRKWDHIRSEWRQEKVKLLNALVGPSQNWIDIQKLPEQTILNEVTYGGKSSLDRIEMAYAREVYEYNKIIIKGKSRPCLIERFAKVAKDFDDPKINEIWEIMEYMVGKKEITTIDSIEDKNQISRYVNHAKKYLEDRYKMFMSTVISGNLRDAQRGGTPSTYNLVSAYVGLTMNSNIYYGLEEKTIEGKPLWPMVYYCLRCGDVESAKECIRKAGNDNRSNSGHEDLIQILEGKYKLNQRILAKDKIKNSTDPFKKVVYCVITGCDTNEQHPEVAKTTDDFLWIQLSLLRADSTSDDPNSNNLTYSGLQTMILEKYGEKYFNAGDQKHLYFQVLALTGQFEAAIEFLSRAEKYRTHVVHVALALNEKCLIHGPRNIQEPLLSVDIEDPVPMRRLNIARLVMLYVKKFEVTDPAEALQYLFFLRKLKDQEDRNLFLVCVSDLAIECRDYALLFGKIQPNGIVSEGLFKQFEETKQYEFDTKKAAEIVGEELVRKGMFEDAIQLFHIAENYGQALKYLSVLLSQVVHQTSKPGSLRERLQVIAGEFNEQINERVRGNEINCDKQILQSFTLLCELMSFFDYYHDKKYNLALEILIKTKLVPLTMENLEICVEHFKRLSGEICKVYPDLLLATMDILYSQYKNIKGKDNAFLDNGKTRQLEDLRAKAKAITNMAAIIPYRMPGDTNKRLVQTEILMH